MCSKCLVNEIDIISKQLAEKTNSPKVDIVIKGELGTGRKTLVHAYLKKERYNFKHVLWINADSKIDIEYSFRKLHHELNLAQYEKDTDILDMTTNKIVSDVYSYLNNGKVLVLFLNLSSDIILDNYLKNEESENVFYIVTTHECDVKSKKLIEKRTHLNSTCIKSILLEYVFEENNKNIIKNYSFESCKIKALALRYYIGYINSQSIKLDILRLKDDLHNCENIDSILDLILQASDQNTNDLLKLLILFGSSDVPDKVIKLLKPNENIDKLLEYLRSTNLVHWSPGDYYSIHLLCKRRVKSDIIQSEYNESITQISIVINEYIKKYQCMDLSILLHAMHIAENIVKNKISLNSTLVEFMYNVIKGAKKLRYYEICEDIIDVVINSKHKLNDFSAKIKIEQLRIKLISIQHDSKNNEEQIFELCKEIDKLSPKKYEADTKIIKLHLYALNKKYVSPSIIFPNNEIDTEKTELLLILNMNRNRMYENELMLIKSLEKIKVTPKICKSKTYQDIISEIADSTTLNSITDCFETCKKELGMTHRKTLRVLRLLIKHKHKYGDLESIIKYLEEELVQMQDQKGVYSILHPAYEIILNIVCSYYNEIQSYDKVFQLYDQSIQVLWKEIHIGSTFVNPESHERIIIWKKHLNQAAIMNKERISLIKTNSSMTIPGYPVQLLSYENNGFKINEEAFDNILNQSDLQDRKLVIISIVGEYRRGKSLFLNYVMQYLINQDKCDWMSYLNHSELSGFSWGHELVSTKNNSIIMWSEAFPLGTEYAVILLDTEGFYNEQSTNSAMSYIFAYSGLISSMQIINIPERITKNTIHEIQTFIEFGKLASRSNSKNQHAFKNILFLVRDWNFREHYDFGLQREDGYLEHWLQSDKDGFTDTLASSYENVLCYLMPSPGDKVIRDPSFQGRICDIDPEFTVHLIEVIELIFSPKYLQSKMYVGEPLQLKDLLEYTSILVKSLNDCDIEHTTLFKTQAEVLNIKARKVAFLYYMKKMEAKTKDNKDLTQDDLFALHEKIAKKALIIFEKQPKLGNTDYTSIYNLRYDIDTYFTRYQCSNTILKSSIRDQMYNLQQKLHDNEFKMLEETLIHKEKLETIKSENFTLLKKFYTEEEAKAKERAQKLQNLKTKLDKDHQITLKQFINEMQSYNGPQYLIQ